ncbi:hypothetical protein Tco_0541151 [Tanacetum coccineum]|uniref:Uncharacterized protein n=1 Tax=Tanacetum coccineum TaxID=301880 RepID=A0ABQ5GRV6_9ASTR
MKRGERRGCKGGDERPSRKQQVNPRKKEYSRLFLYPPKIKIKQSTQLVGSLFMSFTFGEGGDHTDSVTGPSLRTVGPSARFVVLSNSSHHSGAKSADPEVDSFVRSVAPVMTTATTVYGLCSSLLLRHNFFDVGMDKDVRSSDFVPVLVHMMNTNRTLSLFTEESQ